MAPKRPVREIFSLRETVAFFIEYEIALASAQAECGLIPSDAAAEISARARLDEIDFAALEIAVERTGYPVAPFVRQLTAMCGAAGAYVHWGATTQDLLLSARARQINEALGTIAERVKRLISSLASLAERHRDTVMAGRAFGGHALPITFGLKVASWLACFVRHSRRLRDLRTRPIEGEFGGAMGTLASMGGSGLEVQRRLLERLGLPLPLSTASSIRDAVGEVMLFLALLTASAAKVAQDIAQLTWTEIGELSEPPSGGRDTSSTLPQKANPIYSWQAMTAATFVQQHASTMIVAMRQEQERSGHGLLETRIVPEGFIEAQRCLDKLIIVLEGLEIHSERMRRNLQSTGGLICAEAVQMALGGHVGRLAAHDLLHKACATSAANGVSLHQVLAAIPEVMRHFDDAALRQLTDPARYVGEAAKLTDRVLHAATDELTQMKDS